MPTLPREQLAASYLYYDARADDARLTLTLARTAAIDFGAAVANRTRVVVDPQGRRRAGPAAPASRPTTATAAPPSSTSPPTRWSTPAACGATTCACSTRAPTPTRSARPRASTSPCPWSQGAQRHRRGGARCRSDKRSVFVVPWGDLTYIGTTDTDYDGPLDDPAVHRPTTSSTCSAPSTTPSPARSPPPTCVGSWAGLRPLVRDAGSERTADLSRRHRVTPSASGMVTVTGGKLTTYREMAADTVDLVLERGARGQGARAGDQAQPHPPPAAARRRRLRGAGRPRRRPPGASGAETLDHLANRYGGESPGPRSP